MPSVRFTSFGGMRPGVADHLIGNEYATIAHNARLENGELKAFRTQRVVRAATLGTNTIHLTSDFNGTCGPMETFADCAWVVEPHLHGCAGFQLLAVFPENQRAFFHDPRDGSRQLIGFVRPTQAATATVAYAGTLPTEDVRMYTYTWVDQYGIESPPAPPTQPLSLPDDARVRLANFGPVPPQAKFMRVYRTGAKPEPDGATDAVMRLNVNFQLVQELPVPAPGFAFVDTKRLADIEFGGLLTTEDCRPPTGLRGVVATDSGFFVGFLGNTLYVSERNQVWNWPGSQTLSFPDKITGIAECHDTIFVATTGAPMRVRVESRPDNVLGEETVVLQTEVVRSEQKLPGVSARSICATSFGAVYVSPFGLIGVGLTGDAINLTRERVGVEQWPQYAPSLLAFQNGFVYGISPHKPEGIRFEVRGNDDALSPGDFVTVSMQGRALHAGHDGKVYYLNDRAVLAWDDGPDRLSYIWRSKLLVSARVTAFSAGKVVARFGGPLEFSALKVDASGTLRPSYSRAVKDGRPFRINPGKRVTDHVFELRGTATVRELHVATSIPELAEG